MPDRRAFILACSLLMMVVAVTACRRDATADAPANAASRPNILWIVWDTVRADRMSLYGYERPTTPKLDAWAQNARVYDDCISTAGSTVPSHASMFTGLLPSEHGTNNERRYLVDAYDTAAELLNRSGYQTYLFAANPHISSDENFQQGFDVEEHPWDPKYRDRAHAIVAAKIDPRDASSELTERIDRAHPGAWDIKAAGELAEDGLVEWLDQRDPSRPYFAFLNYMEAHRPFIPPLSYRTRLMTSEQVDLSYKVDRSWRTMWAYCFGLHSYTDDELEVMALTYDATLAELDDLFAHLMQTLEEQGHLENTVVILTADHGEHLGEHHLLDHQYGLYEPLLHVPLVIFAPGSFEAGRDRSPASNFDLFPTILELADVQNPVAAHSKARSLLSTVDERARLAEYPVAFRKPFRDVQKQYPQFDLTPWRRTLRAVYEGPEKYIWASSGAHELYDRVEDPQERHDLIDQREESAARLNGRLEAIVSELIAPLPKSEKVRKPRSSEQQRRLEELGYAGTDESSEDGS